MRSVMRLMTLTAARRPSRPGWLLGATVAWAHPLLAWAQPAAPGSPGGSSGPLNQFLQFTYTIAHAIGLAIIGVIQRVLPQAKIPADLVDPIGFLAVLTIFVLLAGVARRIAWIVVVVGWVLIGVRIVLAIAGR